MINNSEYRYPLLIEGKRFFLNKNPFEYAKEGVKKYWSDKVMDLSYSLTWEEYVSGKSAPSSCEELELKAIETLAVKFLADEKFVEYFKQDGGKMIPEVIEIKTFPESLENSEEEREVS